MNEKQAKALIKNAKTISLVVNGPCEQFYLCITKKQARTIIDEAVVDDSLGFELRSTAGGLLYVEACSPDDRNAITADTREAVTILVGLLIDGVDGWTTSGYAVIDGSDSYVELRDGKGSVIDWAVSPSWIRERVRSEDNLTPSQTAKITAAKS